jgi:hypothetical protein
MADEGGEETHLLLETPGDFGADCVIQQLPLVHAINPWVLTKRA